MDSCAFTHSRGRYLTALCFLALTELFLLQNARAAPSRTWGIGTMIGGGYMGLSSHTPEGKGTEGKGTEGEVALFYLPTLEVKYFPVPAFSIDLSVPVSMMVVSAFSNHHVFLAEVFFNFHFGNDVFFLAPGLGGQYINHPSICEHKGGGLRIPLRVGIEYNSTSKNIGIGLFMQPFYIFNAIEGGKREHGLGAFFCLSLTFYGTSS